MSILLKFAIAIAVPAFLAACGFSLSQHVVASYYGEDANEKWNVIRFASVTSSREVKVDRYVVSSDSRCTRPGVPCALASWQGPSDKPAYLVWIELCDRVPEITLRLVDSSDTGTAIVGKRGEKVGVVYGVDSKPTREMSLTLSFRTRYGFSFPSDEDFVDEIRSGNKLLVRIGDQTELKISLIGLGAAWDRATTLCASPRKDSAMRNMEIYLERHPIRSSDGD